MSKNRKHDLADLLRTHTEQIAASELRPLARMHRYLCRHGRVFRGRTLCRSVGITANRMWQRPTIKECYLNTGLVVFHFEGTEYYEGYHSLMPVGFPLPMPPIYHAWAVLDGRVVDITAEMAGRQIKKTLGATPDPATYTYFGVPIPRNFVLRQMVEAGRGVQMLQRFVAELSPQKPVSKLGS